MYKESANGCSSSNKFWNEYNTNISESTTQSFMLPWNVCILERFPRKKNPTKPGCFLVVFVAPRVDRILEDTTLTAGGGATHTISYRSLMTYYPFQGVGFNSVEKICSSNVMNFPPRRVKIQTMFLKPSPPNLASGQPPTNQVRPFA